MICSRCWTSTGDAAARSGSVLEIKHATFFASLGRDLAALVEAELTAAGWGGRHVVIESFELAVLQGLRERGVPADLVFLVDAEGTPVDQAAMRGASARTYAQWLTDAGLDALAGVVAGISLDKSILLGPPDALSARGDAILSAAHERGLRVFTWTCRPENVFLAEPFRRGADLAARGDWQGEWALLRDAGIDGVFVDHADLGVGAFS